MGYVYLLWAEHSAFFKIGFTKGSVDDRALQIQTACPYPLRVIASKSGSPTTERSLHKQLAQFKTIGEWFALPENAVWSVLSWFSVTQ